MSGLSTTQRIAAAEIQRRLDAYDAVVQERDELREALVRCQRIARNPIGGDAVNRIIAVVDKALANLNNADGE